MSRRGGALKGWIKAVLGLILIAPLAAFPLRAAADTVRVIANNNSHGCPAPDPKNDAGAHVFQNLCDPDVPWGFWRLDGPYTFGGLKYFRLQNYVSGMCMAVDSSTLNWGPHIIQWPCGTWADHYWRFVPAGGEIFQIVNRNSGLCLAVDSSSMSIGASIIQWPCGTWADHFWRVYGGVPGI
jgi:ricin-type beta-trefoil lectin protein